MPYKDPEKHKERREDLKQNLYDSISAGKILDQHKWDVRCNEIKRGAKKHPYSKDFTNDIMFDILSKGCFYCGSIATSVDRLDSTLAHTIENCVASCVPCNISKGTADPYTFVRKAYFRARKEYMDDIINIWYVTKTKPILTNYKESAKRKGVPFDLTAKDWDILTSGICQYCKRSPTTWFGIDRVIPSLGYVLDNSVSCCLDCNIDKLEDTVEKMSARNERIADRVDAGDFVVENCPKMTMHNGTHKLSKKVCAHGKVYETKAEASRSLGKQISYVSKCIIRGAHSDDIFEISEDFYEKYKNFGDVVTKLMFTLHKDATFKDD